MDRNGNVFSNLGSILLLIVLAVVVGGMLFVAAKLLWKYPIVKKITTKIYDIVVFNAIIRSLV